MSDQEPGTGPDDLHRALKRRADEAETALRAARTASHKLRVDPRTELLRARLFVEHIEAVLRVLLRTSGAQKLLRGIRPDSISDNEYVALYLTITVFAPTYPNPAVTNFLGIGVHNPPLHEAIRLLGHELKMRLLSKQDLMDGVDMEGAQVGVPTHTAGHIEDRFLVTCFNEAPRGSVRMAKEVVGRVRSRTVERGVRENLLPFRFDYGIATLVEALVAAGKWFRRFRRGSNLPDVQLEVTQRALLGMAETRARQSRFLATAALQARLKHLRDSTLLQTLAYMLQGESALDSIMLDALVQHAQKDGSWSGPRELDGKKLEDLLDQLTGDLVKAEIARLTRRAKDHASEHPSRVQFERLVALAAHNRLSEFLD